MYVAQQYHKTATYKQKRSLAIASDLGAPEGTRTPDLLIRSQTLYPAELPAHIRLAFSPENVFYYSAHRPESQAFFSKNSKNSAKILQMGIFHENPQPAGRVFSSLPLSENEHRIDKYFATFYNIE